MCLKILFLFLYFKTENISCLPTQKSGFIFSPVPVSFCGERQDFLRLFPFFRISINPPLLHNHILFICHRRYMTSHNESFNK